MLFIVEIYGLNKFELSLKYIIECFIALILQHQDESFKRKRKIRGMRESFEKEYIKILNLITF
jgi:hypothetical protein